MVINYNKLLFIVKESKWMLFLLLFVDFGVMLGHSMEEHVLVRYQFYCFILNFNYRDKTNLNIICPRIFATIGVEQNIYKVSAIICIKIGKWNERWLENEWNGIF